MDQKYCILQLVVFRKQETEANSKKFAGWMEYGVLGVYYKGELIITQS